MKRSSLSSNRFGNHPVFYSVLTASILMAFTSRVLAESSLDAVTVTATKEERKAIDVPQSVDVANRERIEEKNARNINDVIRTFPGVIAISKNGGYDSRLIIRGAGLKARYGVREIMVLRDGVLMTDPDSFTRFDFVDIDDMDSVEVFKGPGSIEAANASGGVIAVHSQSVFDDSKDYFKVGAGSETSRNAAIRKTWQVTDADNVAIQVSRRQADNDWRKHNQFDTTQFSIKHGHFFEDDSTLETELSYQVSHLQLPGTLNEDGYDAYLKTGRTTNDSDATGSPWSQSARDSKTLFFNTRYQTQLTPDLEFRPQFYVNQWEHFHPVTGFINDSKENYVVGTDWMFNRKHRLWRQEATQVFGASLRGDIRNDSEKYTYADTVTIPSGRIVGVTSDDKGELAERADSNSLLSSLYFQQTLVPWKHWSLDVGVRYDHLSMDMSGHDYINYNYGTGKYAPADNDYSYHYSYDLWAPKASLQYALSPISRVYASVSAAQQAPTDSELSANQDYTGIPDLKASTAVQYEVGYKLNHARLTATAALYQIDLSDEIVSVKENTITYYVNAGQTRKRGVELSTAYQMFTTFSLGGSLALQDYEYVRYENAGVDYSGNQVRFIPAQQYSVFADYQTGGWQARYEALGFGDYYIDDANSEKYDGYKMVSNVMLSYRHEAHKIQLNVNNLFDMRYAEEVSKDTRGKYSYTPGAPRNIQVNYRYQF